MLVYLIRHGKAGSPPGEYHDDDLRLLTEEGKQETTRLATIWKKMGIEFDKLISSPLLRARQTAEIIAQVYDWNYEITERESMGHMFSVDGVISMLDTFPGKKKVALVGHNPDLSTLAAAFVKGTMTPCVDFKESAIMGINFLGAPSVGNGALLFYMPPEILRPLFADVFM